MAMKMRQSLAQLEQEFWQEAQQSRRRSERLQHHAVVRSRKRSFDSDTMLRQFVEQTLSVRDIGFYQNLFTHCRTPCCGSAIAI